MRATGAGDPEIGRPLGTGSAWRTAALSPVLWGACLAVAAVGLATTAHAAGFGLTPPPVGAGSAAAARCAPSSGLGVAPVLQSEPAPSVVAYRVTAVTVTGLTGCAGRTVSVTIRGTGDLPVATATGVVPLGSGSAVLPLVPAKLDPTLWLGWSADVGTS